jgi:hypothetical protein
MVNSLELPGRTNYKLVGPNGFLGIPQKHEFEKRLGHKEKHSHLALTRILLLEKFILILSPTMTSPE